MDQSRILVGAIDQGTSSSRFLIFDACSRELVCYEQTTVTNLFPKKGWVETDARELVKSVNKCIKSAVYKLNQLNISASCVKAIGISNQRETTIAFNHHTGHPLYPAISWCDSRTGILAERLLDELPNRNKDHFKNKCGLPISNYPSALKMKWLSQEVADVNVAIKKNACRFATVDTWLLWNLTGGVNGGVYKTEVSNASRTGLFNIHHLRWDLELLSFFKIDKSCLAEVMSSCQMFGNLCWRSVVGEDGKCGKGADSDYSLDGVPITAIVGDQMAALVGQDCTQNGKTKNTYGTGCFLLCNTGTKPVFSNYGLLTSVAYQLGPLQAPYYSIEGSVAVAGQSITWLKDNLNIISDVNEIENLAASVTDSGDCFFVPALSGLLCPYWNSYARGVICGLTLTTTKAHLVRACLDAICFQTKDVVESMEKDLKVTLKDLKVDGGMTANNFLMQLQADILGIPIVRPRMLEATALGVASLAASGAGLPQWKEAGMLKDENENFQAFHPITSEEERNKRYLLWKKAIKISCDWEKLTM